MKKIVGLILLMLIGAVIGIYSYKEYEKFHPSALPYGYVSGTTLNPKEKNGLKIGIFISSTIKTFKGDVKQFNLSVENQSKNEIKVDKKCVIKVRHLLDNKKIDEKCLSDRLDVLAMGTSYYAYVLPYSKKERKKYKSEEFDFIVNGVSTDYKNFRD